MRPLQKFFNAGFIVCVSTFLIACSGRDDTEQDAVSVDSAMTPDSFLTAINTHSAVAAGE